MWLLESNDAFNGRRMWLRPGKTYLFGRTASEPGQLAISHSTISRKHLTVTVDQVVDGHAHHLTSRSQLTVEDLATKTGTTVNGTKIRGSKFIGNGENLEVTMGKCPSKFRITWFPVVLTFSFTSKEMQNDPLTTLRQQFEPLDIKLSTEYNIEHTTHVVARKRNTAKGLQALINAKHVVTDTFLDAISQAAEAMSEAEPGALEQDFGQAWPDAMDHLPPRGGEPVQHPDIIYAPDPDRGDVFDGYTFVFYDKTQYTNLMAPITNGGGKALLQVVCPSETQIDEFVRFVKEVAGEKGLGSFEDGSEGKGVVLVRYMPAKGDSLEWYAHFITSMSLRLDHRPIEQNEFLEAILTKDASKLRRPLQIETTTDSQMADSPELPAVADNIPAPSRATAMQNSHAVVSRVTRPRKRRFAGFDDEGAIDMIESPRPITTKLPAQRQVQREDMDEGGLFVSQEADASASASTSQQDPASRNDSSRRRPLSAEDNLMDGMAPAVARFKRQRLERGSPFASASPSPEPESRSIPVPAKSHKKKLDVLAMAARHREEEEARARAEQEDLAQLPEDVDLAEIRRLQIVEELEVKTPHRGARTREQDIADGRWDPKWNGTKNFKKFRRRGEAMGRQPVRTIVPLTEVKSKEFGIGDNYWLEDESVQRQKSATGIPSGSNTLSPAILDSGSQPEDSNSSFRTRIAATPSQLNATSSVRQTMVAQGKRPAPPETALSERSKRARRGAPPIIELPDSDESEDDLKFRFGRRR